MSLYTSTDHHGNHKIKLILKEKTYDSTDFLGSFSSLAEFRGDCVSEAGRGEADLLFGSGVIVLALTT